jgi:hypothetical protein
MRKTVEHELPLFNDWLKSGNEQRIRAGVELCALSLPLSQFKAPRIFSSQNYPQHDGRANQRVDRVEMKDVKAPIEMRDQISRKADHRANQNREGLRSDNAANRNNAIAAVGSNNFHRPQITSSNSSTKVKRGPFLIYV